MNDKPNLICIENLRISEIESFKVATKRPYANTSFPDFISNLIQKYDQKCWLYNGPSCFCWFRKTRKSLLKGKYMCINENCKLYFDFEIIKTDDIHANLNITWFGSPKHDEKLQKSIRKRTKKSDFIPSSSPDRKFFEIH